MASQATNRNQAYSIYFCDTLMGAALWIMRLFGERMVKPDDWVCPLHKAVKLSRFGV